MCSLGFQTLLLWSTTEVIFPFFLRVFELSEDSDKIDVLGSSILTAEYVIGNYLKDHENCLKEELMLHVLNSINQRLNRKDDTVHTTKPIHVLAWLIAYKELENEGVIIVDRKDLPFPTIDNRSRFSLKP